MKLLYFASLSTFATACLCQPVGSIQGTVKNQSGQAVAGVRIIAQTAAASADSRPAAASSKDAHGMTDKSGGFILSGVPAGRYSICVQDDTGNVHIDPCQWSSNPVVVKVAAGESVSSIAVPVVTGTTLQVRIEDPRKLASPRMGANDIFVAVLLPGGRPIPLKVTANDESGKTFQIPVPADQYRLIVLSKRFVLSDSSGTALEEKDDGKGRVLPPQVGATISAGAKNSVIFLSILRNRQ